ncbi:hypothetical protein RRG08_038679 [Elysia crispata]|uniref:Uncharacterized protein n=1 Tax=Elysia crispata TaxID=231223 RepID=A0AAE0ZIP3_9GAST|nr:hypothetical protein RRG08_038679 [Elysia crispata]
MDGSDLMTLEKLISNVDGNQALKTHRILDVTQEEATSQGTGESDKLTTLQELAQWSVKSTLRSGESPPSKVVSTRKDSCLGFPALNGQA